MGGMWGPVCCSAPHLHGRLHACPCVPQGVVAGVLLDKMPAAMRKDVDAAIAELPPGKKQASRWTRREAAERAAHQGEAAPMDVDDGGEGGAAAGPAEPEEEQARLSAGRGEGGAAAVQGLCAACGSGLGAAGAAAPAAGACPRPLGAYPACPALRRRVTHTTTRRPWMCWARWARHS